MKYNVLIVEDESVLYEKLRRSLVTQNFIVDKYTKSYEEAVKRILESRPDVVLLDINLAGDKTGLDLGEILYKEFKIPFIYLTSLNDDMTFSKGLYTNHDHFIVKTKPRLNVEDVTRAIHTVLHKNNSNNEINTKKGVIGLVGYLDEIKNMGKNSVSKVKVNFEEIVYFSTALFKNQNDELERVEKNYCWFLTIKGEYYFLKDSLSSLSRRLPYHFVRINDAHLVNIGNEMKISRINGSRLEVNSIELSISNTYKKEVNKRMNHFYE